VWINEFLHLSPFAPFGGHKQSGFGAEYGIEGLKEFDLQPGDHRQEGRARLSQ
jgi:acyl-CoA reductase-like NAD-dependent aldehyde dehydrogenase